MKSFEITVSIDANSEAEAAEKIEALLEINDSLDHIDVIEVSKFVADYPTTVTYMKNAIPELIKKSTIQMLSEAPKIMKDMQKAVEIDRKNIEAEEQDED